MWILDKKDTAPNPHPPSLSDPNPAKRIGSEGEEIPTIAQFSAKPETERWWEFLSWSEMGDSNSRPDGPKPPALPTALIPDI